MTEQEVKDEMNKGFAEIKPIVEQMTNLIFDAYEKGFSVGMELGNHFTIKEN